MDILLMIATSVACGIAMTLANRRQGIGWWIGDQISALFGAGTGTYMVNTIHMGKVVDYYAFWVIAISAGGAMTTLAFSNWLLGGEEEEAEPVLVNAEVGHTFEEMEQPYEAPEQPYEAPLRRAA